MSDFHDVRFPLHLAFGARGGPVRSTSILSMSNGSESRNAKTRHSKRRYNAIAGLKSVEQASELIEFFEARLGPLFGFRFKDPLDFQANSVLGFGTGEQKNFALIKSYGQDPYVYVRRIAKPVNGSVRCFVDGTETPVFVDHDTGRVEFEFAPAAGTVISAQFEFDVPVRFASESLDIVLDDFGSTQIQDIPLLEILPKDAISHA